MSTPDAFLAEFKRLTRDGSGNAVVAWRALDRSGTVRERGQGNADMIWASLPDGSVIEIEIDGRWIPATSLPPTNETGPTQDNAEPATEEGTSAMDQDCAEACELQEVPRPDFATAALYIERLTGAADTPMNFRLIRKSDGAANKLTGPLAEVWPGIEDAQREGFCVFAVVNAGGDSDREISAVRAFFIDGDDMRVPDAWRLQPDLLVTRDATHWHAYWLTDDCPVADFEATQRRLVAHYGSDPVVVNASRVMRLPGTLHLKDPDHPHLVKLTELREAWERKRPAADVAAGLPTVTPPKRTAVEAAPDVQLDLEFNINRARKHLEGKPRLVIGQHSDEQAFIRACELRELGLSRETTLELLCDWQPEFDDDWWEEKVNNAFRYGQNGAGAYASAPTIEAFAAYAEKKGLHAGEPDPGRGAATTVRTLAGGGLVKVTTRYGDFAEAMNLFRDLTEAGKAKPKADKPTYRFQLRDEATQDAAPDIVPLVEGFLSDGGTACIHGPLGSYKSFVATEIAFAVATGKPCFGKLKVHRSGPVIYLLGEGSAGIEKRRRRTLRHAYGITGPIPFYTCKAVPLTRDGREAVQACVDDIRAQLGPGVRPGLVILDTKTVAMAGLNEDKAGDAQMYVEGATFIAEQLDCLMLTIAHEGLTPGRMRGSTAAPQGIEDVWTIENNSDHRMACLKPVRLKDDELDPIYLKGRAVNVPGLPKPGLVFDMVSEDEYKRTGGKGGPKDEGSAITREVRAALVRLGCTGPENAVHISKLAECLTEMAQPHLNVGSREFRTTLGQQKRRLRDAISKRRYLNGNGPLALFHHEMASWGGSSTELEPHFYLPGQVGDYGAEDD